MDALDFNSAEFGRRPKTFSVLFLLAVAAFVFSYLWAYCLTEVLVAADIRSPISPTADPRPRWLITGWLMLTAIFGVVGWMWKLAISRQLRSIDEMEDAVDE